MKNFGSLVGWMGAVGISMVACSTPPYDTVPPPPANRDAVVSDGGVPSSDGGIDGNATAVHSSTLNDPSANGKTDLAGVDAGVVMPGPGADTLVPTPSQAVEPIVVDAGKDAESAESRDARLPEPDAVDAPTSAHDAGAGREAGQQGSPCQVAMQCGSHSWACWPMPNSPKSDLPNKAHYTDMGNGVVRDDVTCLLWEKKPATDIAYSWGDANKRCAENPFGDGPRPGWRLPTRIELISILDVENFGPAADNAMLPTPPNPPFWADSARNNTAFALKFYDGLLRAVDPSTYFYSRCVKGGPEERLPAREPVNHWTFTNGEVHDNYTGLIWQRYDAAGANPQPKTHDAALSFCATLTLNGRKWRLPSIKELATVVDEAAAGAPLVNRGAFPDLRAGDYWSGSRVLGMTTTSSYWMLSLVTGETKSSDGQALATCVAW